GASDRRLRAATGPARCRGGESAPACRDAPGTLGAGAHATRGDRYGSGAALPEPLDGRVIMDQLVARARRSRTSSGASWPGGAAATSRRGLTVIGETLGMPPAALEGATVADLVSAAGVDRKSTRLNSSHGSISYAVFCLKT